MALSVRGVRLFVVGRDRDRIARTVDAVHSLPGGANATVFSMVVDLTEAGRVRQLADEVHRRLGALDILVHAGGIYRRDLLETASLPGLDELYRTNVRVPYEITQAMLADLVRRRGIVVFVNSTQGLSAGAGLSGFAATQHAMKAMSDSLRAEVNSQGVRVTTIYLGRTATTRQEHIFAAEGRTYTPELLVQPNNVADVVVCAVALPEGTQMSSVTLLPTQDVAHG